MSTPLIKKDSVPISRVQITSSKNGRHETDITNCDNEVEKNIANGVNEKSEPSSSDEDTPSQPKPGTSTLNSWSRRNSVSLPAGLEAIMTEPPEYEPQVSFASFFLNLNFLNYRKGN